jgi:hypothetical protein
MPGLLEQVFSRLAQHGLGLASTRQNFGSGHVNFNEVSLQCDLPGWTLKIFFDHVELTTSLDAYREGIAKAAAEIVKQQESSLDFATFTSVLSLHGKVMNGEYREVLSQFTCEPSTRPGPMLGSGAVFYFGSEGDRLLTSLTIDRSARVEDGIFVNSHIVYDASKASLASLEDIRLRIDETLAHVGLEQG